MRGTLSEEFNLSASEAHDAFPKQLEKLVILSTGSETPVYVSPEMVDALSKDTEAVKKAVKKVSDDMIRLNAAGIAWPYYPIAGASAKMIALRADPSGVFEKNWTQEMRALFVLDHELGHHVVKTGFSPSYKHLGEASADAFGALRHIQRFGKETELFKFLTKATSMVLNTSPVHYTASILLRVREVANERDIMNLSLQETAQLAADIAAESHIDPKTLDKLSRAFAEAGRVYSKEIGNGEKITDVLFARDKKSYALFVSETMAVLREHKDDYDIVLAGTRFLNYPPIKKFIEEVGAKLDIPPLPPGPWEFPPEPPKAAAPKLG